MMSYRNRRFLYCTLFFYYNVGCTRFNGSFKYIYTQIRLEINVLSQSTVHGGYKIFHTIEQRVLALKTH